MNFHGEKRSIITHRSTTDPDGRFAKKSRNTDAVLAYRAGVLLGNCHELIAKTDVRAGLSRKARCCTGDADVS